jgi:serine protease Do
MKRYFIPLMAGMFAAAPAFAQKPAKTTKKEKDVQTIVITRDGNLDDKTVIEIKGDKVLVNGKESDKSSDVNVNVSTMKKGHMSFNGIGGRNTWVFNNDEDGATFFSEDENRAMLGLVTDLTDKGAKITSLTKESAAEKAGLKEGDVITKIDKETINEDGDVAKAIRAHKPGEKVSITVLRDGKEQTLTAELTKWKGMNTFGTLAPSHYFNMNDLNINMDHPEVPMPPNSFSVFGGRPRLGISIQDTEDGKGVKITNVDDETPAAKAGLKEEDIIIKVDEDKVESTDELRRITANLRQGSAMTFHVLRAGKEQAIEVKIPRKLKTANL